MARVVRLGKDMQEGGGYGGKTHGLQTLLAVDAPVPPGYVIPHEVVQSRPWRKTTTGVWGEMFATLSQPPFSGVMVRSSADVEDSAASSCAGLFETVVVVAEEELAGALDHVADSATGERASGLGTVQMGIVVQARVAAAYAGVLFSAHPSRARLTECYGEVVRGAGAGLVDGSCTPSRFSLDWATGKVFDFEQGAGGPDELPSVWAETLVNVLRRVEVSMGCAVDIEWAVDQYGQVWFLQARPVVRLAAHADLRPKECATSWFFDQRFTKPITPLSRTTLLRTITRIAHGEALQMRGIPRKKAQVDTLYFGGLAYVPHRVYQEMLNGAPHWLLAADLRQLFPAQCYCKNKKFRWSAGLHLLGCAAWAVVKHPLDSILNLHAWHGFQRRLTKILVELPEISSTQRQEWFEQWALLEGLTERFLRTHRWSLLWATYAYRAFRMIRLALPEGQAQRLEQQLDEDTVLMTTRANAALAKILAGSNSEAEKEAFIAQYGHRSPSLDYASPTWGELATSNQLDAVYGGIRTLPHPKALPPSSRRRLLSRVLFPVRRFLEMREEQRFEWERVLARQRGLFLSAAERLVEQGLLETPDEIWYLAWEEFVAAFSDDTPPPAGCVAARRHASYVEACFERPHFIGPGGDIFASARPKGGEVMQGIGASAGRVSGRALVLDTPGAIPAGSEKAEIAVLVALDPAWTVLLPHVKGLVIERGGLLSHAAILAREYGVPLVIGVEEVTVRIRTGMTLQLDGERGTVCVVSEKGDTA